MMGQEAERTRVEKRDGDDRLIGCVAWHKANNTSFEVEIYGNWCSLKVEWVK